MFGVWCSEFGFPRVRRTILGSIGVSNCEVLAYQAVGKLKVESAIHERGSCQVPAAGRNHKDIVDILRQANNRFGYY